MMVGQLVFNFVGLREIRDLNPEKIVMIAVEGKEIRDPAALEEIAGCLATATWFDGRHGKGVAFEISRRDGTRRTGRVVRHDEGAVLDFGLTGGSFRLYRGAAFSDCLPEVLQRQGAFAL